MAEEVLPWRWPPRRVRSQTGKDDVVKQLVEDERTDFAIRWLLETPEPAIRALAEVEFAGGASGGVERSGAIEALLGGDDPARLLALHPYTKWVGSHWRLVSLVELGVAGTEPVLQPMVEQVLTWLTGGGRLSRIRVVAGKARAHASQEGNALAVCSRLGLAAEPRVALLAEALLAWQWPDGGWNCDVRAEAGHASFHETLAPIWGLHEYARATGNPQAAAAARRGAELLLERRIFRRRRDGEVINRAWTALHYPPYWHYDILQALLVTSRMGLATDPRASDALDLLERRRLPDGRWRPGGYWWKPFGSASAREVVDWGRSGPNPMITLNAIRVLTAAGRLTEVPLSVQRHARLTSNPGSGRRRSPGSDLPTNSIDNRLDDPQRDRSPDQHSQTFQ